MKRQTVAALIAFLALIIVLTFPLIFNITTCIPGFSSSDENIAPLWDSWKLKYSSLHNLRLGSVDLIAYPFGANLQGGESSSLLWSGLFYILSIFANPVLTYNIQIFINFLLGGFFTYLLIKLLTDNYLSALLGGIVFAFCPYQFVRSWQHLGLTYNEWIPLILLSALFLRERPSGKSKLLFFISLILLFSFDYSITYLGLTAFILFSLYVLFCPWKDKIYRGSLMPEDIKYFKNIMVIGGICFVIILFQFFPYIRDAIKFSPVTAASAHNPYRRPFEDLFSQSARPLSYVLPATEHPLFGSFTKQFIGSPLYGMSLTEHTLYLGWVPLILAFTVFLRWKRRRLRGAESFYAGFFIILAIGAWLFSQPPWWNIGPLKIYMPSFFMYKILPMFRAYCRFGIVLMLAVAVLAGFGLKFVLERFKSRKSKITIAVLFCGAVLFEFWNWPPYKVIDVSHFPAVYSWLKAQPADTVIAEYPLDADSPNEMYKFYQTKHEKKIINGSLPGTYANKVAQEEIKKLSSPATAGILKWMGVKYVLVHKSGYLDSELVSDRQELELICRNPALKLVGKFSAQDCPDQDIMCIQKTGSIDVYEVIALPIEPQVKE